MVICVVQQTFSEIKHSNVEDVNSFLLLIIVAQLGTQYHEDLQGMENVGKIKIINSGIIKSLQNN